MTIRLGVLMDPIQSINIKKDSTFAMLLAAQRRGFEIIYMEQHDLFVQDGRAFARMRGLSVKEDPISWFTFQEEKIAPLSDLSVVLMRKDPPFDMNFIYTTYILERAEHEGLLVVNKPQALRDHNEKFAATEFPHCTPPTLVSSSAKVIKEFMRTHQDAVIKPLDGMGGASIFRTSATDFNLSVIIETVTQHGTTPAMIQRYIPEIAQGDKRILLVDGDPVPYCLARIPAENEARGNLAAGGRGEARPLSERDRWICEQIAPTLVARGLIFVGIDVIGDYLTEINVTSPTCIREIDKAFGTDIAMQLMAAIEAKLRAHG